MSLASARVNVRPPMPFTEADSDLLIDELERAMRQLR